MNKTKKTLLAAVMMACATRAAAYDYPYLVFEDATGSVQCLSVEQLTVTVGDGTLLVSNADGTVTLTLKDLSKMYFSASEVTGISDITTAEGNGTVEVTTLSGIRVGRFSSLSAAKEALERGVYIVRQNGQTQKIAVR